MPCMANTNNVKPTIPKSSFSYNQIKKIFSQFHLLHSLIENQILLVSNLLKPVHMLKKKPGHIVSSLQFWGLYSVTWKPQYPSFSTCSITEAQILFMKQTETEARHIHFHTVQIQKAALRKGTYF